MPRPLIGKRGPPLALFRFGPPMSAARLCAFEEIFSIGVDNVCTARAQCWRPAIGHKSYAPDPPGQFTRWPPLPRRTDDTDDGGGATSAERARRRHNRRRADDDDDDDRPRDDSCR